MSELNLIIRWNKTKTFYGTDDEITHYITGTGLSAIIEDSRIFESKNYKISSVQAYQLTGNYQIAFMESIIDDILEPIDKYILSWSLINDDIYQMMMDEGF